MRKGSFCLLQSVQAKTAVRIIYSLITCIFLVTSSFSQVTFSWRNVAANGLWEVTNNWWNGVATQIPQGNDILFFDNNDQLAMTNDLLLTARYRIIFSANANNSRTIGGVTTNTFFDFGGNPPAIVNNGGVNHTINFPMLNGNTAGANRFEINAANGNLTIGSTIGGGNGAGTRNLVAMGGSNIFFTGVLSNGASTFNFIKEGTGTTTLSAANTYTGSTTITAGTLNLNVAGVLPAANTITVNGGTLNIDNAGALTATNNITLTAGTLQVGTVAAASTVNVGPLAISPGTFINMGTGPNAYNLTINNTSGLASGTLVINNWSPSAGKRIFITNTAHISAAAVLARINFTGYGIGAKLLPTNELVPALLFVTQALGAGNFNAGGSWLNGAPSANDGSESIYIQPGFNLTQNTNYSVLNADIGGTLTMNAVNSITIAGAGTVTHAGTVNMVAGSVITLNSGAVWNNTTGVFTGAASGRVNFAGNGTVTGTVTFPDVTIGGSVNFGTASTIGGASSLTINNGGSVNTTPPTYASGSTLIYASNTVYGRSVEWGPGAAGIGVPHHVRVNAGTTLNLNSDGAARTCRGNLTINGTVSFGTMINFITVNGDVNLNTGGTLSLGGQIGLAVGDILVGGNWNHATGGNFVPNQRAVWFNGATGNQTVTAVDGLESFAYIIINKSNNGNVLLAAGTNAEVNGTNLGYPLQLINGNLDLNGNTITFRTYNVTQHDILIDGTTGNLTRQVINSSATPANFIFTHADNAIRTATVIRNSGFLSLLSFGTNVIVQIGRTGTANSGVNFGNAFTTINGTLQLNAGGFVSTNPPTYATNSLLQYNSGGTYNRTTEWNAATGPGYPYNVRVSTAGTQMVAGGTANTGLVLNLAGSLTVDAGTTFTMAGGATNMTVPLIAGLDITINGTLIASPVANGNIVLGQNWTRNNTTGTFTHNNRSVTFNSANNSAISVPSGSETYYDLIINKSTSAQTVTLSSPALVNNALTLTTGIVLTRVINSYVSPTNLLTLADNATSTAGSTSSFVSGPMRKIGNEAFTFPVGKLVGSEYHYRTLGISAPSGTTEEFTAEFWRDNPYNRGNISAAAYGAGLSHISRCEYWDLSKSVGATDVNVTLSWSNNPLGKSNCNVAKPNLVYVDDLSSLVVVPFYNSEWGDQNSLYFGRTSAPGPANPVSPALGFITWNGGPPTIDSYIRFTLGSTDWRFNPLPVNFIKFDGFSRSNDVLLNWTVKGNLEQKEYLVERSSDGINFSRVELVAAKDGLAEASYTSIDPKPYSGLNYYRLTAFERAGGFRKSQTIQVWFGKKAGKPSIYPNPIVNNQVSLYANGMAKGTYTISLTGMDGRLVMQTRWVYDGNQPVHHIELNPFLSRGMYWITINGGLQEPIQLKIIK